MKQITFTTKFDILKSTSWQIFQFNLEYFQHHIAEFFGYELFAAEEMGIIQQTIEECALEGRPECLYKGKSQAGEIILNMHLL